MRLTKPFVERALENSLWDLGNQVLYDLCRQHPLHKRDDVITAKIWLIGRAYSASIERRVQDDGLDNESFYRKAVAPAIRRSRIDNWITQVSKCPGDATLALKAHEDVTSLFKEISGLGKTSLASKYLHFHVPAAFFIFDSRARIAMRSLPRSIVRTPTPMPDGKEPSNRDYALFYRQCLALSACIKRTTGQSLSPRDLDKVLLAIFEAGPIYP